MLLKKGVFALKDRLKILRKALGLTQKEFASRIGISRGSIATYETREGTPGNSVVGLICREFNVSEEWLRTGDGEMFVQRPKMGELREVAAELLLSEPDDIRTRFIMAISRLSVKELELLEKIALRLVDELNPTSSAPGIQETPADTEDRKSLTDDEIEEEVEKFRKSLLNVRTINEIFGS